MNFIAIFLLVALILIMGLLLTCLTSSPPQEDPLENIHVIGLEARQEMDRVCNDFVLQQVQHLLNSCTSTSHTDARRK